MNSASRADLAFSIFESIRVFQKRNRFVGSAQDTPFSPVGSHSLIEITSNPKQTAQDLSLLLRVNKSSISRTLASLEKLKVINRNTDSADMRAKVLKTSTYGHKVLSSLNKHADRFLNSFEQPMSSAERAQFYSLLSKMGAGFGIPLGIAQRGEHPSRPEIRRFTRALGILSDNIVDSGLTVAQWHILSEISEAKGPISPTNICRELNLARTTMSINLGRMLRAGLIGRSKSKEDARVQVLRVTAQGERRLRQLKKYGTLFLESALKEFSIQELQTFDRLFKIFAGRSSSAEKMLGRKQQRSPRRIATQARSYQPAP